MTCDEGCEAAGPLLHRDASALRKGRSRKPEDGTHRIDAALLRGAALAGFDPLVPINCIPHVLDFINFLKERGLARRFFRQEGCDKAKSIGTSNHAGMSEVLITSKAVAACDAFVCDGERPSCRKSDSNQKEPHDGNAEIHLNLAMKLGWRDIGCVSAQEINIQASANMP